MEFYTIIMCDFIYIYSYNLTSERLFKSIIKKKWKKWFSRKIDKEAYLG